MSGFSGRIDKAKVLQDEVVSYLDNNGIGYILSGYEHLQSKNGSRKKIKYNGDKTSLFIRHYPDVSMVFNNASCLLEVKNSSGIEHDCYYNYLSLSKNLKITVLLYLKNNKICKIQDLKLRALYVDKTGYHYDNIAKMHIPALCHKDFGIVWKAPRLLPKDKYFQYIDKYKVENKNTSGSCFAFIDFNNTAFYERDVLLKIKEKYSN